MRISFRSGDISVGSDVNVLTVGLGRKFVLTLHELPGTRIRWTTENDPVLDLREAPDKLSARVTATGLGVGWIYITQGVLQRRVTVTVIPMNDGTNEAAKLNGTIGEQTPDN
jgi:hypothetical protein